MKTHYIILSVVAFLLMLFSSCREIRVTTRINADGSFTRIITVSGDSSDVYDTDLPFPVDETWATASSKDSTDSAAFILTYSRTYRNSDELNEEIKRDTGEYSRFEREVSVTKRFCFFFSYLTFKEVYRSANPFNNKDNHKSLSEEDISWFNGLKIPVTAADSLHKDEAEERVMAFFLASATAEVDSIIKDGIRRLDNPLLNSVDISRYYDSLYNKVESWDGDSDSNLIDDLVKWSGNDAFYLLNDLTPPLFAGFEKKSEEINTIFQLEGYTEEVEMPGLITATNSAMLSGNLVRWEFQPLNVIVRDFEMYAESRVINYWAFAVAGIVLLAMVVMLVIKAVRN